MFAAVEWISAIGNYAALKKIPLDMTEVSSWLRELLRDKGVCRTCGLEGPADDNVLVCDKCSVGACHEACLREPIPAGVPLEDFRYLCDVCKGKLSVRLPSYGLRSPSLRELIARHWRSAVAAAKVVGSKPLPPLAIHEVVAALADGLNSVEVEVQVLEAKSTAAITEKRKAGLKLTTLKASLALKMAELEELRASIEKADVAKDKSAKAAVEWARRLALKKAEFEDTSEDHTSRSLAQYLVKYNEEVNLRWPSPVPVGPRLDEVYKIAFAARVRDPWSDKVRSVGAREDDVRDAAKALLSRVREVGGLGLLKDAPAGESSDSQVDPGESALDLSNEDCDLGSRQVDLGSQYSDLGSPSPDFGTTAAGFASSWIKPPCH